MLVAMPKVKSSNAAPFPFFGAGKASYFEWAEVHVRSTGPREAEEGCGLAAHLSAASPPRPR